MPPIRVNLEAISGCCDYFLVLNCIILSICHANVPLCLPPWCWYRHFFNILSSYLFSPYFETIVHLSIYYDLYILIDVVWQSRYRYDLSVEEAAELARRAIYHATFRDGASGGVASGNPSVKMSPVCTTHLCGSANSLWLCVLNVPLISLLRWTQWMEKAFWRWCRRTSLQLLSRDAKYSRSGNGWSNCRLMIPYRHEQVEIFSPYASVLGRTDSKEML